MGENIGYEGSSISGGRAPQSRRLYVGMVITLSLYSAAMPMSGLVAICVAPSPHIFYNMKKIVCKKHFAQVSE